ncbi:hypothetical protein NMG60_11008651 [Bertholletia excelsa]
MRFLFKFRPWKSNSGTSPLPLHIQKSLPSRVQVYFNSSELHHSKKTERTHAKNRTGPESFASLFDEITQILGTENLLANKTSNLPVSKQIYKEKAVRQEQPFRIRGVRENATVGETEVRENIVLDETQLGNTGDRYISPTVHKLTDIVRGGNGTVPMEEQLENSGFEFDSEVVQKVLMRCMRVPYLAIRFFNWVKMKNGFIPNTKMYNALIYIAGEAKEFELVEELVKEMENNLCQKDHKTWTILIMHYGKAKLIGKALLKFEQMRKSGLEPDAVVYKTVLSLLCNAGKADIALVFYKEMVGKDMILDMGLYKLLLKCLAQCGDISAAYLVAEDMIKISEVPECHAFSSLLKSFCISGRIREALELIRELKHKNASLETEHFETLVKGLCRADRIADALEIVDILKKRNSANANIYGILINGYLRRNDVSKALDLFQCIKDSAHRPRTSTYTELLQHLFRLNEFQKASEIYHEILEKEIELDNVAMTAIVAGHIRQSHIAEAWEFLKSMEEKGVRATQKSYTIFIKELCKASKTNDILKVLDKMQASKIVIRDHIFLLVRSYLEKKGEMEKAEKVKQIQRVSKIHPHESKAGNNIMLCDQKLSANSNLNHEEEERRDSHLLESFPNFYDDHDTQEVYRILSSSMDWCAMQEALEKCTIKFNPPLVLQILQKCRLNAHVALHFFSWVGKQADCSHTAETYNMAIKISGQGKDFRHMRSLFFEMRRNGCAITSDTWTIMIMQYGRAGLTEIALRNFKEMKVSNCKPTGSTYKCLITSLCEGNGKKVDEAIMAFHEMINEGFIPAKELIEIYLKCLCGVGKLLDARRCIESLKRIGFTVPLAYSLYVRALCRAGRLEEALTLIDEVGPEQHTLTQYTYGSLVHALLRRGKLEEALAKVESMKQLGIRPTVHIYTSLMAHFFKENQTRSALEVLEKMKGEGCEPTIVTYMALIRGYINSEKLDDAMKVFHHIKLNGPSPDFRIYSMLITCLCRVGKSEEALQLISEMLDHGIVPSAINFRTVFYGLNREGKRNLADTVLHKKLDVKKRRKFIT